MKYLIFKDHLIYKLTHFFTMYPQCTVCESDRKRETEARLWGFGIIMSKANICLVFIKRMNGVLHSLLYRNVGSKRTRQEPEEETGEG